MWNAPYKTAKPGAFLEGEKKGGPKKVGPTNWRRLERIGKKPICSSLT